MSEYINRVEVIKYHARQISNFCKEHRCATCPFYTPDGICKLLTTSPCDWKGIAND